MPPLRRARCSLSYLRSSSSAKSSVSTILENTWGFLTIAIRLRLCYSDSSGHCVPKFLVYICFFLRTGSGEREAFLCCSGRGLKFFATIVSSMLGLGLVIDVFCYEGWLGFLSGVIYLISSFTTWTTYTAEGSVGLSLAIESLDSLRLSLAMCSSVFTLISSSVSTSLLDLRSSCTSISFANCLLTYESNASCEMTFSLSSAASSWSLVSSA